MHIRMHLVRFMYINLVLSCCFWLYDNVAAADASAKKFNGATRRAIEKPAVNAAPAHLDTAAPKNEKAAEVQVEILPNYKKLKKVSIETSTTANKAEDNEVTEYGTGPEISPSSPRISAKSNQHAAKDTSVVRENVNALPLAVYHDHINNNDNYADISVNPNSENYGAAVYEQNAQVNDATEAAEVPKNQLNNINMYYDNAQRVCSDSLVVNTNNQPKPAGDTAPSTLEQPQKPQQTEQSFPEIIAELPTVTVTELPLEHVKNRMDAVILDKTQEAASDQPRNKSEEQQQIFENGKEAAQKDDQVLKINDPGGGISLEATFGAEANATVVVNSTESASADGSSSEANINKTLATNITAEEVPMPVFSEWAQKQMEAEASREQAMELEQQVVNSSTQRRNATASGSGKQPTLKLRAKNYASPDCGAKIIASNGDATNTGAVLSHSSDEYMLSTCGSRIWFVVELCEAIQAQKVELANFELFSSSPKNFTVAVSKRFPTRDWSNVGRFVAEDKRTVQPFDLHPHLFGKFVRVDIHSHYSKEHFCPVSLFRVFGTSEFEAFETEIRHSDELDDFYDDFATQEHVQAHKTGSNNIFQSASDAVMQMVKKAAEVLVKPTKAFRWTSEPLVCQTPTFGIYSCGSCNSTVVERINSLLSCQFQQLQVLLALPQMRQHMQQTRVCNEEFGLEAQKLESETSAMTKQQSYYLSMLPTEYIGAMCKLLEAEQPGKHAPMLKQEHVDSNMQVAQQQTNLNVPERNLSESSPEVQVPVKSQEQVEPTTPIAEDKLPASQQQLQQPPVAANEDTPMAEAATTIPTKVTPTPLPADVNIFNVPLETEKMELYANSNEQMAAETPMVAPSESSEPETATTAGTSIPASQAAVEPLGSGIDPMAGQTSGSGYEDNNPNNWESIDNLLTTTVASITAGGGAAAAAAAVVNGNGGTAAVGSGTTGAGLNLQQKLTNGAQSESVFIRLSNRIKALERNMSLSGQYLEELSRRYKKQVEELQQTLTQQSLTVRTLEDQSRRFIEQEQLYRQQSVELSGEVRALTYQVQACILVIIIVGTCIFLMLVLGTVYYRKLRRQTLQLKPTATLATTVAKQKLSRRKSYEEMPVAEPMEPKKRRPSEEAMLILKDCRHSVVEREGALELNGQRQRKVSVCYGSNNNITANMLNASARASLHKRKGAKHSWHSTLDSSSTSCVEQLDKFFDVDTLKSNKSQQIGKPGRKKLQQALKRQESAPGCYTQSTDLTSVTANEEERTQSDFDESLMLDDDDLENFIPTSDLAYNEFMPGGPSGYQIVDSVDGHMKQSQPQCKEQSSKKSRRLSSPAFFKSPFSKNKNKGGSFNGSSVGVKLKNSHSAHEATSWEWYRLRRSEKQQQHQQQKQLKLFSNGGATSPNASLDSSSLSEINFPLHSNHNSFRILGEAIMSSGESNTTTTGHSNGNHGSRGNSSGGSGSGDSTTSSTTKKKQRSFNNIFRKVF
ncbi:uncharacterized protein LOC115628497 [Scaptodrosophila lebanonensis]|uniref:Uncharacterized protein LOC115628497 n=1 Tax=Drosophila lebanonensis TaxID=7225 RepID=A0A6J2TVC0_DROLE|nr:uncharacterized protein LOC115628497 [Scaptodrosophila lebanonensis]